MNDFIDEDERGSIVPSITQQQLVLFSVKH